MMELHFSLLVFFVFLVTDQWIDPANASYPGQRLPQAQRANFPSINGKGNNFAFPNRGSVGQPYLRRLHPDHSPESLTNLPPARMLSLKLSEADTIHHHSNGRQLSELLHGWGQFFYHDIVATPANMSELISVDNVPGYPQIDPTFYRSRHTMENGRRTPYNSYSTWIDGSMVYGPTEDITLKIREFKGGRLKVADDGGLPFFFLNSATGISPENPANRNTTKSKFRLSGDMRCNQNQWLLSLHTLFVLEHNRWCKILEERNSSMSDEELFWQARNRVIAIIQRVTFREYIPAILGKPLRYYEGYDSSLNVQMDVSLPAATLRYGHPEITPTMRHVKGTEVIPPVESIDRIIFQPFRLMRDGAASVPQLIAGLVFGKQHGLSLRYADYLRHFLHVNYGGGGLTGTGSVGPDGRDTVGIDLFAWDVLRGRDHEVPFYNDARELWGLPRLQNFREMNPNRTDELFAALEDLYGQIDRVELIVGLFIEKTMSGSSLGDLGTKMLEDQFTRLRDADRFYYETGNLLLGDDHIEIHTTRLQQVLLRNFPDFNLKHSHLMFAESSTTVASFHDDHEYTDHRLISDGFHLSWRVDEDKEEVCFSMQAFTLGWVGIGFGDSATQMKDLDVVMGWFNEDTEELEVRDMWATDIGPPVDDELAGGTSSIYSISGERDTENVITRIKFCRKLDTGDVRDNTIKLDDVQGIAWAYNSYTPNMAYHGPLRGFLHLDIGSTTQISQVPIPLWVWLAIGGGVLFVVAVLLVIVVFQKKNLARARHTTRMALQLAKATSHLDFDRLQYLKDIPNPTPLQMAFVELLIQLERISRYLPDTIFLRQTHPNKAIVAEEEELLEQKDRNDGVSVSDTTGTGTGNPTSTGDPSAPNSTGDVKGRRPIPSSVSESKVELARGIRSRVVVMAYAEWSTDALNEWAANSQYLHEGNEGVEDDQAVKSTTKSGQEQAIAAVAERVRSGIADAQKVALQIFHDCARETGGNMQLNGANGALVVWGAQRNSRPFVLASSALEFGFLVGQRFNTLNDGAERSIRHTISLSHGSILVGHTQTKELQFYSALGLAIDEALECNKLSKMFNIKLAATGAVKKCLGTRCHTRVIGRHVISENALFQLPRTTKGPSADPTSAGSRLALPATLSMVQGGSSSSMMEEEPFTFNPRPGDQLYRPMVIHEILGRNSHRVPKSAVAGSDWAYTDAESTQSSVDLLDDFDQGVQAMFAGDFARAVPRFQRHKETHPDDLVGRYFLHTCSKGRPGNQGEYWTCFTLRQVFANP